MENKLQGKNIFESGFDSFELDDGFFLKMDADLRKTSLNRKEFQNFKNGSPDRNKSHLEKMNHINKENDKLDKNPKSYDLSFCIDDLNETDVFDLSKSKKLSSSIKVDCKKVEGREKSHRNTLKNGLSPILGSKACKKKNISFSTPLKSNNDSSPLEQQKSFQNQQHDAATTPEFDYLEPDLFEDWNLDIIQKCESRKQAVTLSQALQLIEETEESAQKENLNNSVDLLTGEVISDEVESLFAEPFDKLKSIERVHNSETKVSSDDSVILLDNYKSSCKPTAAQKLKFSSENSDEFKEKEKDFSKICFSSDDDFDFFTQDLLKNVKRNSNCTKPDQGVPNVINKTPERMKSSESCDWSESIEEVIKLKKRKGFNIIESDTTEDSPSPKFQRQKRTRKQRNFKDNSGREFIDLEAEVSEGTEISSDEDDEEGQYDQSFLDEKSYFTQNSSVDITSKYLQSVKSFVHPGTFKIPAMKSYDPDMIFSQVPEENNTDYLIDSFCVNDAEEEEVKTDLSDLEIAEKILEMDKKRKKRICKSKRAR